MGLSENLPAEVTENWAKCLRLINTGQTAGPVELLVGNKYHFYTAIGFCFETDLLNMDYRSYPDLRCYGPIFAHPPFHIPAPHFLGSLLPSPSPASPVSPSLLTLGLIPSALCFTSRESMEIPGFREFTRTYLTWQSAQPSRFSLERKLLHSQVLALVIQWLGLAR